MERETVKALYEDHAEAMAKDEREIAGDFQPSKGVKVALCQILNQPWKIALDSLNESINTRAERCGIRAQLRTALD